MCRMAVPPKTRVYFGRPLNPSASIRIVSMLIAVFPTPCGRVTSFRWRVRPPSRNVTNRRPLQSLRVLLVLLTDVLHHLFVRPGPSGERNRPPTCVHHRIVNDSHGYIVCLSASNVAL